MVKRRLDWECLSIGQRSLFTSLGSLVENLHILMDNFGNGIHPGRIFLRLALSEPLRCLGYQHPLLL